MYFTLYEKMLEVCFSTHPNIYYRTFLFRVALTIIFYSQNLEQTSYASLMFYVIKSIQCINQVP